MTNHYVCTELAPDTNGYVACKNWVIYNAHTWVDALAITKQDMVIIGGSIIGTLAVILAFVIVAKAVKTL